MARKIIQLERTGMPSDQNFRVAMWLDVPAARQLFYADAAKTSAVKGATQAEIDAIKAGAVVEVIEVIPKLAAGTVAEWRNDAEALYARLQQELTNRNAYARYGTFWDGATWTPVTVA
jgi:FAD/FMN-containing dehydrogenase